MVNEHGPADAGQNGLKMTAKDARKLTDEFAGPDGPAVRPWLDTAYRRIREAAAKGERRANHPFHGGPNGGYPGPALAKAVFAILRRDGFEVEHHTGDYSDPREGDWDEVTW